MRKPSDQPNSSAARPAVPSKSNAPLVTYEALYISDGEVRKIWFEAATREDAVAFAKKCGFGLQGEFPSVPPATGQQPEPAGAFGVVDTGRILGGMSRTAIYRLLTRGKLSRVKDTRKVLVTRKSIDRYLNRAD